MAAQSTPAMTAPVSRLRSQSAVLMLTIVLGLLFAFVGWVLGAASLSAAEPNGSFVDCGPALFNRPDPLPHASCADAYYPLPAVSELLIAAGVLGVVIGACLLVRNAISNGRPS